MMMMDKEDHERSRDRERGGSGGRRDRPTRFSSNDRDRSPDRGKDRGGMKSSNCRVYVSNIPYEYRWQDLKDLFRQQVGEVSFVELFVDENDKPRGCGIVEFAEASSAKKCLEVMHRFELKGRKIVIKEDFGNQRDKYGNLIGNKRRDRDDNRGDRRDDRRYDQHGPPGNGGGGGGGLGVPGGSQIIGNTYGLSPAFLDDLNIQTPLNTRIFVANLEYKVDKKKLKEVFRMAGKVISVDMPVTKEGTRRGFAVIEYDHPVESVQAISMFNGHPLYERAMTVRMDRGPEHDKLPEGLKTIGPGLGSNGEPLRDVARNLPSLVNQPSQTANINSGPGILGAVPNLQLNAAANALGSLGGSALSSLGSTSAAVLQQAATLGLSNNLLAGSLGNNDIGLGAASLLQNNPSLAALAATSNSLNSNNFNRNDGNQSHSGGGGGGGSGGVGSFLSSNQGNNYGSSNASSMQGNMSRNSYQTGYESSKPSGFSFGSGGGGGGGGDRDNRSSNTGGGGGNMYNSMNSMNSMNNGGQMLRGNNMLERKMKNKLLIANLPPTAHYKLITEKCQEFGSVEDFEEQGVGTVLVTFQTEWDAERAMKNIDRARIDGCIIDARVV